MKKSHIFGAVCALSILAPIPSLAVTVNLTSTIDGAQANAGAGTGSAGTGFATMTLDDATLLFSWNVAWSGVDETLAHFHGPALPNQNAGVQVSIDVAANPAISSTTLSAAQAEDLLAGLWYINIHTVAFPGGEIRGQVSTIPIPAAVWIFSSGLLGLIGIARRKKSA